LHEPPLVHAARFLLDKVRRAARPAAAL
jgi:hypothetical protein